MARLKPWTVMVYLAADDNLADFAVDSLKQMKAFASNMVNVIAEFDSGPTNSSKRYAFGGGTPFGSLQENEIEEFAPRNAGDPDNLADFIIWGARRYPADHYFVIIWGHGGGVDDAFPDNSFVLVPRHRLLNLFKGILDIPQKGILDIPQKSILDTFQKSVLTEPQKEISSAVRSGFDVVHKGVVESVRQGLHRALHKEVLVEVIAALQKAGLEFPKNGSATIDEKALDVLQNRIIEALHKEEATLRTGPLDVLRQGVLGVLEKAILEAFQTGSLYELQREVLGALRNGNTDGAIKRLQSIVQKELLQALQAGILDALRMGVFDSSQDTIPNSKSLAFVDHPTSYLTNADLKKALKRAAEEIGQPIDILGMDACNMNMVEIGYELRESVNFMVASQDDIPDASWPYDRLLANLAENPFIFAKDLACLTAETFVTGYRDYSRQPVTLSVLDLRLAKRIVPLFHGLAKALQRASATSRGRQAIIGVRNEVRNFGQNEFIDVVHFCQLLTRAKDSVNGDDVNLELAARSFLADFDGFVICNKTGGGESNCNGTSIYFPQPDPARFDHQKELEKLYNKLDFARITRWNDFLGQFVKYQTKVIVAAGAGHN